MPKLQRPRPESAPKWQQLRRDGKWLALLAAATFLIGAAWQWPLVAASWRGNLEGALAQARAARRLQEFQGIKIIDLTETHAVWQQGQALIIDARPHQDYQELHIPGAVNLPPEKWADLDRLPLVAGWDRQQSLVVYCSQESCDDALKLGRRLQSLGFAKIMAFTGGFRAWDEAGYPVDTGS